MSRKDIQNIFEKVQNTSSCHRKYVRVLKELYKKTPVDTFLQVFLEFLKIIVRQGSESSVYTKRALNFASLFCADLTLKEEKESESHDFLAAVIEKTLEWSCLNVYDLRYNSCYFIAIVLQDIGEDVQLEINLIDEIQKVMLERMQEPKIPIRLEAMAALVRLQDPQNFECPVINAYVQALSSGSSIIRKEATSRIAPNMFTLGKIKDRIRDVDPSVRSVAFHKCADIGPSNFKIAHKHMILLCGFKETNDKVKTTFYDYLLPKWLTAYRGNYLNFVGALKLVADEEDINKMTYLCKELIREFYNKHSVIELIAALPINKDKLIDVGNLSNDVTLFWNILVELLRQSGNMDEHLDSILPELTPFCHYIERVIKTKASEKMDEWKFFEYQFDLLNLFEIAENYDFSDEVGRRTMQSLATTVLQNNNFTIKLTKKLVSVAQKCSSNIEFFTCDMCQLISDVREPLVEEPMSQDHQRERDFKVAELRVKINILREKQNEAVNQRDYQTAQILDNELVSCNKQLEELQNQTSTQMIRMRRPDNETLCCCLDILASVLELPVVDKLTPSLVTCRDHFLVPLISNQSAESHWRVLKCLALFSVIDKATAEEYAKVICIPIATYRTVPMNNVSALIQSVCGVTDIISLYGVEIVSQNEETDNTTLNQNMTKRKLYSTDSEDDMTNGKIDNMTLSYIFEIFLDMLDDEREEIRYKAVLAITALIKQSFPVTPTLFSRILLKWYSPLTEKQDIRLEVYLGLLIDQYLQCRNSIDVMKETIVPTLSSIANAPKTSPLADIDVDNVLMFFSENMNISLEPDDLKILVLDISMKISENTNDRIVPLLTKLMCNFDLKRTNAESASEMIDRAEMLLEDLKDKAPRRHVEKFIFKLRQVIHTTTGSTEQRDENENSPIADSNATEQPPVTVLQEVAPDNEKNRGKEPQQIKRRKHSNGKNCVVILERMNWRNSNPNETTLHTIVETSMEMKELDLSLTIDTPTTDSSKTSKNLTRRTNSIVISETSDSDFSNDTEATLRRSTRCRKKRILTDV